MSTAVATKDRPILFSGEMVRAVLDGRKTQTRRILDRMAGFKVKQFGPSTTQGYDWHFRCQRGMWQDMDHEEVLSRCPYGQTGDRLWVRETWAPYSSTPGEEEAEVVYRASYDPNCTGSAKDQGATWEVKLPVSTCVEWKREIEQFEVCGEKWKPSIHMPRWASRIELEVTEVRVERLQDIGLNDVCSDFCPPNSVRYSFHETYVGHEKQVAWCKRFWDGIYGPGSWAENDWVWVVGFKRL